ncbi:hypothetical protein H5410_059185 [Solanum commersonii]|uniref:Lipocalin/cytosolic fatty-acid binding domain-containing protein n=1 Tax=Solanum commersonii TaxID=4109 RepID=A0A9J5W1N3_SOLCO|nr:hypothetical protein H5410_059185 [Solanum commersonii]
MATKVMEVVKNLDLKRYMGRWYEIASFPSRFQPKDGVDTRATYTLNSDGTVHVLNETWSNGKRGFIEGTAYKADPNSDEAKLKVRFYVPPFLPIIPVTGDYWVLYIDEDYQYALIGQPSRRYLWLLSLSFVIEQWMSYGSLGTAIDGQPSRKYLWKDGQPSRKYLWILSRRTCLDDEIYNQLVEKAKEEGYDVSKLHKTPQSDSPPESEDSPEDTKGIWWIKSILGK